MEITINLARNPFIDMRPILRWLRNAIRALAALSLLLALIAYLVHRRTEEARSYVRSLEKTIGAIREERQSYQAMLHRPQIKALLRETGDLNQIVEAKALSWTLVMEGLEAVLPNDVQVTAIEPTQYKDSSITLHIRVIGPRDRSIDLVRNLELSKRFYSPRIVSEAAGDTSGASQKLAPLSTSNSTQFDLLAGYDPDSPDDAAASPSGGALVAKSADAASLGRSSPVQTISDHKSIAAPRRGSTLQIGATK